MWFWILIGVLVAGPCAAGVIWLRRWRRLGAELSEARRSEAEWASLAALEHDTSYRLACKLYGKAAVEEAISKAHERGEN